MPPKTPSIASVSSLKKFGRAIKKPFTRSGPSSSFTPPEKKEDPRPMKDKQEDVVEAHKEEVKESTAEVDKQHELKEKTDKVFHPKKAPAAIPSSSNLPKPVITSIDEEYELEHETVGNYAAVFDHNNDEGMNTIRYGERSAYTPNAVSIFESLFYSFLLLTSNLKLMDKDTMFFSPLVCLYYSVIYYIRILSVREVLGENNDNESRFFRAFQRKYKLESLPVAGFLECEFANIAYYEPKDRRVTFLFPQLRTMMVSGTRYRLNEHSRPLQPNVHVLYDWVHAFCDPKVTLADHRVVNNTFVPYTAAAGHDFNLGGYTIAATAAAHVNAGTSLLFSTPGIDRPTPETIERLIQVKVQLQRTGFTSGSPARLAALADDADPNPFAQFSQFLRMENDNWDWFGVALDQATEHGKHFNGMTYLGNIPIRGSLEIGFINRIRVNARTATDIIRTRINLNDGEVPWFPHLMRTYHGKTTWYEPNAQDYHFQMARQSMTNSRYHIYRSISINGAAATNEDVQVYNDATRGNAAAAEPVARFGPFFGANRDGTRMEHDVLGARGESRENIEYARNRLNFVRKFYSTKTAAW